MRNAPCRSLSVATDIIHWHEAALGYSSVGPDASSTSQQQPDSAHQGQLLLPLFDECVYAMLTVLSFSISSTVKFVSVAAAAAVDAAAKASCAPKRRDFDEFDLDSPSPPPNHKTWNMQQELLLPAEEPYRLDRLTASALVLQRSEQVMLL